MRKVVVTNNLTLDGEMQAPGVPTRRPAVTLRKKTSNGPPRRRIGWVVTMGFDGDDDWALSHDGWILILAGGDRVVDDFADDLEALRSGGLGFKDTSMFQALPPL